MAAFTEKLFGPAVWWPMVLVNDNVYVSGYIAICFKFQRRFSDSRNKYGNFIFSARSQFTNSMLVETKVVQVSSIQFDNIIDTKLEINEKICNFHPTLIAIIPRSFVSKWCHSWFIKKQVFKTLLPPSPQYFENKKTSKAKYLRSE